MGLVQEKIRFLQLKNKMENTKQLRLIYKCPDEIDFSPEPVFEIHPQPFSNCLFSFIHFVTGFGSEIPKTIKMQYSFPIVPLRVAYSLFLWGGGEAKSGTE